MHLLSCNYWTLLRMALDTSFKSLVKYMSFQSTLDLFDAGTEDTVRGKAMQDLRCVNVITSP